MRKNHRRRAEEEAVLIFPYCDDASVVRVVLVRSTRERGALMRALSAFDLADAAYLAGTGPEHPGLEAWLEGRGFGVCRTVRVTLPLET